MSESQNYEEVTVTSNGVTVIKTFEADAFPVPAIAFRINSDRTEAVTVRLVDDVPENVAVEDLGFHPEYGSEYWTIEDDEITFEREIEAEEQYTTVYGIRATGTDNVEQFLTEPEIAEVDPPLEDEDGVVGGSGSDVVRDVISGNADSVPGLDDEEEDEDIGTLDLTDPNAEEAEADPEAVDLVDEGDDEDETEEEDETEAEDTDDEDEAEEVDETEAEEQEADTEAETEDAEEATEVESDTGGSLDVESVASALATEIEEGEVDDDDLEVLRSELEIESGGGTGGAVEARIEKLQSDVTELDAYVDALEEFLEENGTGQDLIEGLQDDVATLEDQLGGLEDDIEDNSQQVASLEDSVEGIQGDLQSLKGDVKDVDDDIDAIQGSIDDLEDELDDIDEVDDRVDDIEADIVELKEWREQLSNVLGAADD
ncbi:hypothetical protein SAMN05216388_1005194 [Halorientalis persicus]|jgi:predicted  nucleic acid-binding Zn-ribbon protein|uniref:t-SNARE coiled-coil homology domain-containing protein n=1 Tax=Halorientalis persicus TaxID=1367881 RepID=A0A1H8JXC3_9EURY|nr:hypothetical protein [Halorientalis persicus]SEN84868.1 hypothetical protein SAMN05216388_1005194 [Halorientalis persicus]